MPPAVSVLLPVHNGAAWLPEALASVHTQTLTEHELIVVDDGSTDATAAILAADRDPRLTVLTLPWRMGMTRALNHGLALCRPPYVARLDADDQMRADRLAVQRAYLDAHPEVGVVGSWSLLRGPDGTELIRPAENPAAIRRALRTHNPIAHSTVMVRRCLLDRVGGYDEAYPVAQDFELWTRLAPITDLVNLPLALTLRRSHAQQVSARRPWARRWAQVRIRAAQWATA
jgi:glycosyltransferase involved in cell wall biosynthesis